MANEITISASLSFSKGGKTASAGRSGLQDDMTGSNYFQGTQTIGTSEEALNKGDIGTPGYIWVRNLDATNFVEIRAGSSAADVVKLMPGKMALFYLASSTPYAIADSGACEIEYLILEE